MPYANELSQQIRTWRLDFGRNLAAYRARLGIEPQEMAELLQIDLQQLVQYESGVVLPTIHQIDSFFSILGMNSYKFYGHDAMDNREEDADNRSEDEKPPLFTAYEDSFPLAQYAVLELREVQKMSIAAIARTRDLPIENVRKVYNRAKTIQKRLYLERISQATGKTPRQITREYREWADMFAYLEREYGDILSPDEE